jgi:homoserine dehydrogenase
VSNHTTLNPPVLRPIEAPDCCQGIERVRERRPLVPAAKHHRPVGAGENQQTKSDSTPPLLILKLGGSILTTDSDLSLAVHEIYRHLRRGSKVIAVVSALYGATDRLLKRAHRFGDDPDPSALAALLATGELTSAALLALACQRAGIPARTLDSAQIQLRASGPTLDSTPTSVNTQRILSALETHPVLILPGFIARDGHDNPTLLGRGGSDLTALFLARKLSAPCRLLKDVPGVFESDPRSPDASVATRSDTSIPRPGRGGGDAPSSTPPQTPHRYSTLSFSDLASLNAKVVQPKTAAFARDCQIVFEVGAPLSDDVTTIGPPTSFASALATRDSTLPLRIALLGHGTVGAGVAQAIRRLPHLFQLASIAIRDPEKHANHKLPRRLFTTNPFAAINSASDIVIELIGGTDPAYDLITQSLARGKHVITANKAVIARHGDELRALAAANSVQLLYSAAVGGSLPILETARRLEQTRGLFSLEAILNGASNFILTRLEQGLDFPSALAEAQSRGLTEADPTRDTSGQDALDKLHVIANELWPDLPIRASLTPLPTSPRPGTRQVARLTRSHNVITLVVSPEQLPPTHPLSQCAHDNNAAIFTTADNHQTLLSGKGAGRHPTTESVLADLLELSHTVGKLPTLTSASC